MTNSEAILTTYDNLWRSLINYAVTWQNVTKCDNMWQHLIKSYGQTPSTVTKCHKTSDRSDTKRHRLSHFVRICHILSEFVRIFYFVIMKPHEFIKNQVIHLTNEEKLKPVESFHMINKCNDNTTKVSRSVSFCSYKGKMQNKKRILSC